MSSKKVQTGETWCNEVIISRYNFPIFFILLKLILTPKQTLILTLIRLLFQTGARHWKHCETRAEICALNVRCRAQVAYWVHCTYVFCARYTFRARRFSSARGKSSARTTKFPDWAAGAQLCRLKMNNFVEISGTRIQDTNLSCCSYEKTEKLFNVFF